LAVGIASSSYSVGGGLMSEELYQEDAQRPAELAAGEPIPAAVGAGRAQRSEPERSDGERRCVGQG
jgi:hypothetical protein